MKAEQLRKSILQMAIQGKLVPQDPTDEPASVLLEKIRAEKQRLIKEGKIKKDKVDSVIFKGDDNRYYEKIGNEVKDITEEIPFDIPDSWEWMQIKFFAEVKGGKRIPAGKKLLDENNGHIYIRVSDMQNESISTDHLKYVPLNILPIIKNYTISQNDLYLTIAGTIGKVGIVPAQFDGMNLTENAVKICNIKINRLYLLKSLQSNYVQELFNYKTNKVAQPKLAIERIITCFIPIPPLAEQERIVAAIENYEPLILEYDKLEQQKRKLDGEIYEKLKKSVLQYAIQGKLIPQNSNDEPASILLERIRTEKKAKLGKKYVDSYIYKGDDNCYYEKIGNNEPVLLENLPFEIPESWAWARLGTLISLLSGRDLEPNQYNDHNIGIPYITGASNFIEGNLVLNRWTDKPLTVSKLGDLLLTCKGTIGTMAFNNVGDIHIARQVMAISTQNLHIAYIKLFLESYVQQLQAKAKSFIPGIGRDDLNFALIPIPPLSEQIHITQAYSTFLSIVDKGEI